MNDSGIGTVGAVDDIKSMNERIIDYINSKWKNLNCPLCSGSQWATTEIIYELRQYHGRDIKPTETAMIPIIPIMCENCGYTLMVNSIAVGFTKKESNND